VNLGKGDKMALIALRGGNPRQQGKIKDALVKDGYEVQALGPDDHELFQASLILLLGTRVPPDVLNKLTVPVFRLAITTDQRSRWLKGGFLEPVVAPAEDDPEGWRELVRRYLS
jgi:hypothetical protein